MVGLPVRGPGWWFSRYPDLPAESPAGGRYTSSPAEGCPAYSTKNICKLVKLLTDKALQISMSTVHASVLIYKKVTNVLQSK